MTAPRETWHWAGIGAGVLGVHLAVAAWLAHTSSRDAGAMPKGLPEPLRIAFVARVPVATPPAAEPPPVEAPVTPPPARPKEPPPPTPRPVARATPTSAPATPSPVPTSPSSNPRSADARAVETTPADAASEATASIENPVSTTSTSTNDAPAVDGAPSGNVAGVDDATRHHAESTWQSTLLGHLEHHRRYPHLAQRRREEGVTYVRFRVDRSGRVLAASLERGSGVEVLDEEALEVLERAQPVPPPPRELAGDSVEVVVPVHFRLRRR